MMKFNPFGAVSQKVLDTVGFHPRLFKLSSFRAKELRETRL
jgi:hypothetical protein